MKRYLFWTNASEITAKLRGEMVMVIETTPASLKGKWASMVRGVAAAPRPLAVSVSRNACWWGMPSLVAYLAGVLLATYAGTDAVKSILLG